MSSTKKKNLWTIIITVIVITVFTVPALLGRFGGLNGDDVDTNAPEQSYILLDVYDAEVQFAQDSMTLDLLKGTIKTNQQVDKIFINVNGYGTEYVDFNADLIRTEDSSYIAHAIRPKKSLLSAVFNSDVTLTVDVYVEYAGRSVKVNTQKVAVKGCWTDIV